MSIRVIGTLIVLAALALIIFLVLKRGGSGQNRGKRPPTPPGPYENDKDNAGGKGQTP
jgi:hypothetical protein